MATRNRKRARATATWCQGKVGSKQKENRTGTEKHAAYPKPESGSRGEIGGKNHGETHYGSFGWDVHNEKGTSPQYKEVVVEKFSNSGDRPDYTLTLNGVSKIFVEAKKPAVNIKEESEPAIQARRYGWNAKHKLSILTNFEDMMIYDVTNKPQDGDAATVSLYRKYHYLEYLKKYEEIYELISRESVYTGKYDEYVEEKFPSEDRYSTEVDEVFLKQINEWRLEIGDYLYHMDSTYKDIR